jgi:hypothetical protein
MAARSGGKKTKSLRAALIVESNKKETDMGCFSLAWLLSILIPLIVICAIIGIVRVVLPVILGWLGVGGEIVMRVFNIILIAVVLIILVYFCIELLSCAGGRIR